MDTQEASPELSTQILRGFQNCLRANSGDSLCILQGNIRDTGFVHTPEEKFSQNGYVGTQSGLYP